MYILCIIVLAGQPTKPLQNISVISSGKSEGNPVEKLPFERNCSPGSTHLDVGPAALSAAAE